jgi:hypothetical protein
MKILKYLGFGLIGLIAIAVIAGLVAHESLPDGTPGAAADALARKMEFAIKKEAWDSTRFVSWKFVTGTAYLWDKEKNAVLVEWGDNKVLLNTRDRTGKVYVSGSEISDSKKRDELLAKAWAQFANDSFWLCAPMKVFDPGTTRKIVVEEDGSEALMVHYSSGGVTPGDSYLWELDANGMPVAWRMWVNIIPVGGLRFTWKDWKESDKGALIAQDHAGAMFNVPIIDLSFPTYADANNPLRELW